MTGLEGLAAEIIQTSARINQSAQLYSVKPASVEGNDILRRQLAMVTESNGCLSRLVQRIERGDPRVCVEGRSNPKYFDKFGCDE